MSGSTKIELNSSKMAYVLGVQPGQMSEWMRELDNPIPVAGKKGRAILFDPQVVVRWWHKRTMVTEISGRSHQEGDTPKVIDFHAEKTRLTRAQADEKELKLQQIRRELVPVDMVAGMVGGGCQILSSALSSIPAELQRVAPHLSASDIDVVRKVLARTQNAIAEIVLKAADLGFTDIEDDTASG